MILASASLRKLGACLAAILLLVMFGLNCHECSQTAPDRINIAVLQTLVQLHAECDNKLLLAPCGSMSLENLIRQGTTKYGNDSE